MSLGTSPTTATIITLPKRENFDQRYQVTQSEPDNTFGFALKAAESDTFIDDGSGNTDSDAQYSNILQMQGDSTTLTLKANDDRWVVETGPAGQSGTWKLLAGDAS